MSARDRVFRLVRRARTALDALRVVQGAARGALVAGVAALVMLLAMKAFASLPVVLALPWAILAAGLVAGALAAAARPRIAPEAAALFLDARLGTDERIVTLVSCPADRFTDRVAGEIDTPHALPRLPLPREATLVPLALFCVFAAGLLPEVGAGERTRATAADTVATEVAAAAGAGKGEAPEVDGDTLRKLERGLAPGATEAEAVREAVARLAHRPEDRAAAAADIEKARGGDAAAAKRIARTLRGKGGAGETADGAPATAPAPDETNRGGMVQVTAYPEAEAFLRAYREALGEENR